MKNPFKFLQPSEEKKHQRALEVKAFREGIQQAKVDKLKKRVISAKERGYQKEMEGRTHTLGVIKSWGKSAGKGLFKVADICADITEGLQAQEESRKRTKKRRRRS